MAERARPTVLISFRVLPEVSSQYTEWSAELGMTRSNFLALAALLGAKTLMRQISPEKFITPELVESLRKAGYDVPEKVEGS